MTLPVYNFLIALSCMVFASFLFFIFMRSKTGNGLRFGCALVLGTIALSALVRMLEALNVVNWGPETTAVLWTLVCIGLLVSFWSLRRRKHEQEAL